MSFLLSAPRTSCTWHCVAPLFVIGSKSIHSRLEGMIRREFASDTVEKQNLHLENLLLETRIMLRKKLNVDRMPCRIMAQFMPRDCHSMSRRSSQRRHCPRVVCGLPDGMIASVDVADNDGETCLRIYNPHDWKSVTFYHHGLINVLSPLSQLWHCKIDDTIYIILHLGDWLRQEDPEQVATTILCWKWDGINLEHFCTKHFRRFVYMAVSEDGMFYYTEYGHPTIHAFNLLHLGSVDPSLDPDSGYRTVPCRVGRGYSAMAVVGNYLLVARKGIFLAPPRRPNGLYVYRRETLEECHFLAGSFRGISDLWLKASSCGVVAVYGDFCGVQGLHALSVNRDHGTIEYHSCLHTCDLFQPYHRLDVLGYALEVTGDNKMHVYDIDTFVGQRVRSIDLRLNLDSPVDKGGSTLRVKGLVATNKGLFLFLHIDQTPCRHGYEVQLYVGYTGESQRKFA